MKTAFLLLVSLGLIASLALPVFAIQPGDVVLGQEVVLRIRYPAGGLSVQERADIVTQRINELLGSNPFSRSDVKVGVRNKEHVVLIGNNVIITADDATARFNKTTPEQLAEVWAANLRRVIPEAKSESR